MAILRSLKDQLIASCRTRIGEISVVDVEGVVADGNDDIDDFYAGLTTQENSATLSLGASASNGCELESFALRFGIESDRFIVANLGFPLCRAARHKRHR